MSVVLGDPYNSCHHLSKLRSVVIAASLSYIIQAPVLSDINSILLSHGLSTLPDRTVKVTVLIVTFNHVNFVTAAIDSALGQKASFPIEIIVSEDASDDGTSALVERIVGENRKTMRLLPSKNNLRSNEVVARGIRAAKGQYIALLDGDDYWTSTDKIQRQADFLDANSSCAAVFLNARVAVGDTVTDRSWTPHDQVSVAGIRDIWLGNPYPTCGSMMRTDAIRRIPNWYASLFPITDWPLYILSAERGDLAFIDEDAGVYRLHSNGAFSSLSSMAKLESVEKFYQRMNAALGFRYDRMARGAASRFFFDWAKEYQQQGDYKLGRSCLKRCLRAGGVGIWVGRREVLRLGISLFHPG
jgi:glycosyltransferase involved in cell wall biosynthesis